MSDAYAKAITGHAQRVLLLGVTPTLADLGETMVAVDINNRIITNLWPGDTATRKAIQGNWLDLPLCDREFTAVVGDGVLVAINPVEYKALFGQLAKVLLPNARIMFRLYETPEPGERIAQVRDAAMGGSIKGFHAFKWRLAMAIAAQSGNPEVPVMAIHEAFERNFPERAALSAATGWPIEEIAEIDAYDGNRLILHFPTRRELLAHLPPTLSSPRFLPSGDYELSERCPFFVTEVSP